MKITAVRVLGQTLPFAHVQVETDAGLTGIGYTGSPGHIIAAIVEGGVGSLRQMLIGEDPCDTGRLWHKMFTRWQAQRGRGTEGGLAVNAMGAIDMALWDIAGKAQGVPIYRLLGGAVQPQVMAYASASAFNYSELENTGRLVHKSPAALAQEVRIYVQEGFQAIKFGWGNYFAPADEEKLAAMREAAGPAVRLMLDFGCPAYWTPGWNVKAAIQAARLAERYGIYFFEEPMLPADVVGHAALSRAVDIQIATGESLTTVYEFERYIEIQAVDILQPDAGQMGITQFLQVVRRAAAAGLNCVPHGPWSALLVAAHLNVLCTVPHAPMIEYPAFAGMAGARLQQSTKSKFFDVVERPIVLQEGWLQLPTSPGLGLGNFVPDAIARMEQ